MGFSTLIATTPPKKCILTLENLVRAAATSECTTNLERKILMIDTICVISYEIVMFKHVSKMSVVRMKKSILALFTT